MSFMNPKSRTRDASIAFLLVGFTLACVLILSANIVAANMAPVTPFQIPIGLILPVTIDQTISLSQVHAGDSFDGRIAQDVPLTKHDKITHRSRVSGTIVSVVQSGDSSYVDLSLRFEKVEFHKQMIPLITSLRALASYEAVRTAQIPFTQADTGTPTGWADTTQIGGDIRFGDGGPVRNLHKETVGKGVFGGVLVHVRAAAGTDCEGPVNGDDRLQALWFFSADACGTYGLPAVHVTHTGKTAPVGVITLRFEKAEMKLDASDAFLLRVVSLE